MKAKKTDSAAKLNKEQADTLARYYGQLYRQLFGYAKASLWNSALAEEAVQETFCRACRNIVKFTTSPNPPGWLMIVLKNVMMEMRDQRAEIAKMISDIPPDDVPDKQVPFEHDPGVVRCHYSGILPERDFALLWRVAVEQRSMKDAAEEFGLSLEACKKHVRRKSQLLAKKLKKF